MYKVDYFKEPIPYNFNEELIKIPGLDGSGKMGKSEGNGIYLIDDEKTIRKKVMKAKTDAGPQEPNSKMPQEIVNLFTIAKIVSSKETVSFFKDKYNDCSIRYGDFKKQLAEDIIAFNTPIREKIKVIYSDEVYLKKIHLLFH